MNNVEITGQIKNRAIVELFVANVLKELKIHRFTSRYIDIKFSTQVEDGAHGYCHGDNETVEIEIAKNAYPLEGGTKIRPLGFLEIMKTLAHELVHAKQFLRGELIMSDNFVWKGRLANNWSYENQPWEKEAERLEDVLFIKCFPWHLTFTN